MEINSRLGLKICMRGTAFQVEDVSKQICAYAARCRIRAVCVFVVDTGARHTVRWNVLWFMSVCFAGVEGEEARQSRQQCFKPFYTLFSTFTLGEMKKSPYEDSVVPSPEPHWAQPRCSNLRWSESSQGGPPSLPDSSSPLVPSRKMETI